MNKKPNDKIFKKISFSEFAKLKSQTKQKILSHQK